MQTAPTLLLTTKLYRPRADLNWVARPVLFARLDAGLTRKLTLLSAPPGFGKSTLVSQWLDYLGADKPPDSSGSAIKIQKFCWLSLDQGDNELVQFLRYLIAAVRTCEPTACPTTQSLLGTAQLPSVDYLADVVVSELTMLTVELVLVLDDYHRIRSDAVHQVMRHLLRYLPPRLHLVILSRTDPPLHLGRLRIEQQLTELRASDLRFAVAETRQFLDRRLSQPLDDDALKLLHARTEGWITALQLSSIALQNHAPYQFLGHFRGSDRLLVSYLVEEVMAQLPLPVREFLLRTAIVTRFCAPLCAVLLSDILLGDVLLADNPTLVASRAILTQLEEQNLFLVALDNEGDWYRYHDLFRDFILHQLKNEWEAAAIARLHRAASAWFAQAGLLEDALHHALAAGEETHAAELVEAHFPIVLNDQIPQTVLARWLALFSAHTIHSQPGLLIAQATLWATTWHYARLPPLFGRIETLLQEDATLSADRHKILQAHLDLLRGIFLFRHGEVRQASGHLQAALANLPAAHESSRAQAISFLVWVYSTTGQRAAGFTLLQTALAEDAAYGRATSIILLGAWIIHHLYAGELVEAAQVATRLLALVEADRIPKAWQEVSFVDVWRGYAHYYLGAICYERNDLAAATQHWRQVEKLPPQLNSRAYHESLLGLAQLAQARGSLADALAYAQASNEFATELGNAAALASSEALITRLALLNGQRVESLHRSEAIDTAANLGTSHWLELPPLTRIRVLLANATPELLMAALQMAEICLQRAEEAHNTRQVIQISALQALVLHAMRRQTAAFRALEEALALAAPRGFVRTFLDLGAPMTALLSAFASQRGESPFIQSLLAAFTQDPDFAARRALTTHYAKLHGITPLTPREIELLVLIRQRRSINEIAATLVISPNTVKKHANNIYTKLGVRNRREALVKAEELNLLPPM